MHWRRLGLLGLLSTGALATGVASTPPGGEARVPAHFDSYANDPWFNELRTLKAHELDALFLSGEAKHIPLGQGVGFPLLDDSSQALNSFATLFWRGKNIFPDSRDPKRAWLNNRVLGLGLVKANVYKGDTRKVLGLEGQSKGPSALRLYDIQTVGFDGRPSVILDYGTSDVPMARGIRDEIRQVWPKKYSNLYLGRAWIEGKFWVYFALKFKDANSL